jgi:hypothetical protein
MSDPNDNSIPVLHEILVPGHARSPSAGTAPSAPEPDAPREPSFRAEPVLAPQPPHNDALASSAGVFDRAEPVAPAEAGSIVPPDIAHEMAAPSQPDLDAEVIAERLRGRFAGFLTGEGRGIIEARCRDALQEHTTLLVSQITREVALTLETEMGNWVREAVEEEIARRAGRG